MLLALAAFGLSACGGGASQTSSSATQPSTQVALAGARAVLVGEGGAIFLTTDGEHWQQRPSGTKATLLDVAFADAENGWAVGFDGTILHTADGGLTWTAQTSGLEDTERSLLGVSCLSPTTAWIVGFGVALRTTDGGEHWQRSRSIVGAGLTPADSRELDFADATTGWAAHGLEILATSDGGLHWTTQHRETKKQGAALFDRVVCSDVDHVWAGAMVGPAGEESGVVWASQDGGRTWRRQLETRAPIDGLCCTDSDHVWVLADGIYRSVDGGAHWRRVHDGGGSAVAFADARHGWIVGGTDECTCWGTNDGGRTWHAQPEVKQAMMLYAGDMTAIAQ